MREKARVTSLDGIPDDKWLTLHDVAGILSMHYSTVYDVVTRGGIPFLRVGRAIRVQARDLRAFIDAHRVPRTARGKSR